MKKASILFFLLLISCVLVAQSSSLTIKDSLVDFTKRIFLIDNIKESTQQNFKNPSVFDTPILKLQISNKSDITANKDYSIKLVQNKLCGISYDYQKYLYRNKQEEKKHSTFSSYNIDGKTYPDGFEDTVYALLMLNPEKVKRVQVKEKRAGNYSFTFSYEIYITTKN